MTCPDCGKPFRTDGAHVSLADAWDCPPPPALPSYDEAVFGTDQMPALMGER